MHTKRDKFEEKKKKKGFEYVYLKYCKKTSREYIQEQLGKIKRLVKKVLRFV